MDIKDRSFWSKGLSTSEVNNRLEKYGQNTLIKRKKVSPIKAFFNQFADPMVILLLIATVISLTVAIVQHALGNSHGTELIISYIEPFIILLVVLLNSCLGAYQEVKSDQAVRALEQANQSNATVIRDGQTQIIPANFIVPGDILIISAGDTINADGRILESSNFNVVEASLTGESNAVEKHANLDIQDFEILAQNSHLVYSGTYATNGKALVVVEKTGSETELGKINNMIQDAEKVQTPLQIKLNKLGKIFGYLGIVLLFVSFLLQVLLNNVPNNIWNRPESYTNALIIGLSFAVAAIPEGLMTFTSVILSIGVKNISKQNGLVKNLLGVETLGSTSIICTDKTGTLTENKMTVVAAFANNSEWLPQSENTQNFYKLAKYVALNNDSFLEFDAEHQEYQEIGDPTEIGLLKWAKSFNYDKKELLNKYTALAHLPFDSDRKMMSILIKDEIDNTLIVKGAPDIIISKCINLNDAQIKELENINKKYAQKTYRVLAIAHKKMTIDKVTHDDENNLEFVGLVAMIDPPRAEVKNSIAVAQKAGIKVVMITGDHRETAVAIAKEIGIYSEHDRSLTGEELSKLSDEELKNLVPEVAVYARVNPQDKLRIVQAWQAHDKVVSMTGDGVNDAPALKRSDIGCAMGITGTDVSKQAADLILLDDNFNTIVNSVKNGRSIYDKIKTVIQNLLISSLTEVIVLLVGMIAFYLAYKNYYTTEFYVFSASQLLWINLLSHGLPAIALGLVDSGKDVMARKPFDKRESIFARGMGWNLVAYSAVLSLLSLGSYAFGAQYAIKHGLDLATTASTTAFITLGFGASINALNLINNDSIFITSIKKYWKVHVAAAGAGLLVILAVLVPQIAEVFKMSPNMFKHPLLWLSLLMGLGLTIFIELKKLVILVIKKHKQIKNKLNKI